MQNQEDVNFDRFEQKNVSTATKTYFSFSSFIFIFCLKLTLNKK